MLGTGVKIGDLEEGQVVDMTWRLVSLRNRSHYTLNVTNRMVADQPIKNFSFPSRVVRITDTIYFDAQLDPGLVQSVLDATLGGVPGLLAMPAPSALFGGMRDRGAEYRLRYFIDNCAERDDISEAVWKSVVDAARQSGLTIALPRQYLQLAAEPWQGGGTSR